MKRSLNKSKNQHASVEPVKQAACYGRLSSDQQYKASIEDQLRKCREKAEENGHVIPSELVFTDEAVSGTKHNRDGLNALVAAVDAGKVKTV